MKVAAAIAVLLSATSGVVAHKCAQGQVYCGSSLINVWARELPPWPEQAQAQAQDGVFFLLCLIS